MANRVSKVKAVNFRQTSIIVHLKMLWRKALLARTALTQAWMAHKQLVQLHHLALALRVEALARIQVLHQHKLLIQVAIMLKHLQIDSIMQRAIQQAMQIQLWQQKKHSLHLLRKQCVMKIKENKLGQA